VHRSLSSAIGESAIPGGGEGIERLVPQADGPG